MYPVHGAATAFYKSKFWVLGGSTGDDSYDHTITDKVLNYKSFCYKTFFQSLLASVFLFYCPLLSFIVRGLREAACLRTLGTSKSITLITNLLTEIKLPS